MNKVCSRCGQRLGTVQPRRDSRLIKVDGCFRCSNKKNEQAQHVLRSRPSFLPRLKRPTG